MILAGGRIKLLFVPIAYKLISGSQLAGWRTNHDVREVIFLVAFWMVG